MMRGIKGKVEMRRNATRQTQASTLPSFMLYQGQGVQALGNIGGNTFYARPGHSEPLYMQKNLTNPLDAKAAGRHATYSSQQAFTGPGGSHEPSFHDPLRDSDGDDRHGAGYSGGGYSVEDEGGEFEGADLHGGDIGSFIRDNLIDDETRDYLDHRDKPDEDFVAHSKDDHRAWRKQAEKARRLGVAKAAAEKIITADGANARNFTPASWNLSGGAPRDFPKTDWKMSGPIAAPARGIRKVIHAEVEGDPGTRPFDWSSVYTGSGMGGGDFFDPANEGWNGHVVGGDHRRYDRRVGPGGIGPSWTWTKQRHQDDDDEGVPEHGIPPRRERSYGLAYSCGPAGCRPDTTRGKGVGGGALTFAQGNAVVQARKQKLAADAAAAAEEEGADPGAGGPGAGGPGAEGEDGNMRGFTGAISSAPRVSQYATAQVGSAQLVSAQKQLDAAITALGQAIKAKRQPEAFAASQQVLSIVKGVSWMFPTGVLAESLTDFNTLYNYLQNAMAGMAAGPGSASLQQIKTNVDAARTILRTVQEMDHRGVPAYIRKSVVEKEANQKASVLASLTDADMARYIDAPPPPPPPGPLLGPLGPGRVRRHDPDPWAAPHAGDWAFNRDDRSEDGSVLTVHDMDEAADSALSRSYGARAPPPVSHGFIPGQVPRDRRRPIDEELEGIFRSSQLAPIGGRKTVPLNPLLAAPAGPKPQQMKARGFGGGSYPSNRHSMDSTGGAPHEYYGGAPTDNSYNPMSAPTDASAPAPSEPASSDATAGEGDTAEPDPNDFSQKESNAGTEEEYDDTNLPHDAEELATEGPLRKWHDDDDEDEDSAFYKPGYAPELEPGGPPRLPPKRKREKEVPRPTRIYEPSGSASLPAAPTPRAYYAGTATGSGLGGGAEPESVDVEHSHLMRAVRAACKRIRTSADAKHICPPLEELGGKGFDFDGLKGSLLKKKAEAALELHALKHLANGVPLDDVIQALE
jgi:hypothetical protein